MATAGALANAKPQIIAGLFETVLANYSYTLAITLILYDICLTFSREVKRVWQRKITGATVLYAIVRYGRVLGFGLWVVYLYSWVTQTKTQANYACEIVSLVDASVTFVINIAIAMLLAMRISAIFQANLWVLFIILIIQAGSPFVQLLAGIGFTVKANPPPFTGCNREVDGPLHSNRFYLGIEVVFAAFADLLTLALTGIKTLDIRLFLKHVGVKRSYLTLLLRDGTFYYLVFILLDIAMSIQAVTSFTPTIVIIQAIRSNMICRLVLNLHDVHLVDDNAPPPKAADGSRLVSVHMFVARYILGNMGAPLIIGHDDESEDVPFGSKRRLPRGMGRKVPKVEVLDIKRVEEFPSLSYSEDSKESIKTLDDVERGSITKDNFDEEDDVTLIGHARRI